VKDGRASGPAALLQADVGAVVLVSGVTDEGTYHYLRQTGLVDVYMATLGGDGRSSGEPRGAAGTFIGFNLGPAFSPDGRVLAFAQMRQMGKSSREALGLRDVEQGTSRVVQTDMTLLRLPRWSPDGGRLLVKGSDKAGRFGFHLIDPTNGRSTPVVTVPPDQEATMGSARWVPDGSGILYSRMSREGRAIFRHDLASGDERVVYRYEPGSNGSFDVGSCCLCKDGTRSRLDRPALSLASGASLLMVARRGPLVFRCPAFGHWR
jgi:Tol biopolymer transport system component